MKPPDPKTASDEEVLAFVVSGGEAMAEAVASSTGLATMRILVSKGVCTPGELREEGTRAMAMMVMTSVKAPRSVPSA